MKLPAREELDDYVRAIGWGAIQGAMVGAGVSAGLYYYLRKKPVFLGNNATFLRAFTVIGPVMAVGATSMEFASRRFEYGIREKRDMAQVTEEKAALERQEKLAKLSAGERFVHHLLDHRYSYVTGAWALCMGGSYYYINRSPYLSKAQKVVQARMYAQGLTIALLVASVALTSLSPPATAQEIRDERRKAWEHDLEIEMELRKASDDRRAKRDAQRSEKLSVAHAEE